MTGQELAAVLADRFERIVPPGFHVEVQDGLVVFWADDPLGLPGQTGQVAREVGFATTSSSRAA